MRWICPRCSSEIGDEHNVCEVCFRIRPERESGTNEAESVKEVILPTWAQMHPRLEVLRRLMSVLLIVVLVGGGLAVLTGKISGSIIAEFLTEHPITYLILFVYVLMIEIMSDPCKYK